MSGCGTYRLKIGHHERAEGAVGLFQGLRLAPVQAFADVGECGLHIFVFAPEGIHGFIPRWIRPATSPSVSSPARPLTTTSSPSSSQVRCDPSARTAGSAPSRVSSSRQPASAGPGPLTVPDANRSPVRTWRSVGREVGEHLRVGPVHAGELRAAENRAVDADLEVESQPVRRIGVPQVGDRRRDPAGGATRACDSAASGVIHGDTDVANDLPRNGPRGRASKPWMSRADQSLSRQTPKTCSSADATSMPVPGTPTTNATSASRSSRWVGPKVAGAEHAGRAADRRARDHDRAGPAVVADRQVPPVLGQRIGARPQDLTDGRRVLLGRVEVDVVGDGERQHGADVVQRQQRRSASASQQLGGGAADLGPHLGPAARNASRVPSANSVAVHVRAGRATASPNRTAAIRSPVRADQRPVGQVVQAERLTRRRQRSQRHVARGPRPDHDHA